MDTPSLQTAQLVKYDGNIAREIALFRLLIDEVIDIVAAEGKRFGVPIRGARVNRFSSREVPGYRELVITFYSDAERSKVVDFFPRLAECIGEWRRRYEAAAEGDFADQLAVDIMPLAFWDDVRS